MKSLLVESLSVSVEDREVVRDFSLSVKPGEIHVLMGPNGSGKSSVAYALMGHPAYQVTNGSIKLGGEDLLGFGPEERAGRGLFLSFQEPPEIGGVSINIFLKTIAARKGAAVVAALSEPIALLGLEENFLGRFLNEGFSGGEKKKSEMLQFLSREPAVAILDEIDSGLDMDALRGVAGLLSQAKAKGTGVLLISHSPRLFKNVRPDYVHVLIKGRVAAEGSAEILERLEEKGYGAFDGARPIRDLKTAAHG